MSNDLVISSGTQSTPISVYAKVVAMTILGVAGAAASAVDRVVGNSLTIQSQGARESWSAVRQSTLQIFGDRDETGDLAIAEAYAGLVRAQKVMDPEISRIVQERLWDYYVN